MHVLQVRQLCWAAINFACPSLLEEAKFLNPNILRLHHYEAKLDKIFCNGT